jgi:hypothetical protein
MAGDILLGCIGKFFLLGDFGGAYGNMGVWKKPPRQEKKI